MWDLALGGIDFLEQGYRSGAPERNLFQSLPTICFGRLLFSGFLNVEAAWASCRPLDDLSRRHELNIRADSLPDLPTQKAIADFLDRETARIDQLIEKKQRLVEVLGEKRQVVISHAVTKGELDPSVRMQEVLRSNGSERYLNLRGYAAASLCSARANAR